MVVVTSYQTIAIPPAGTLDFLGRMDQQAWRGGESSWKRWGGCSRTICQDKRVRIPGFLTVFSVVVVVVVASSRSHVGKTWNVHS